MYDKVDFGPKWHFDPRHPSQIGLGPKTVILGLKTLKKHFLSIFHLWHLKSTLFCYQYHFFWFFQPFQGKNGKKMKISAFQVILIKRALGHQKWVSESPGIGHRTRFRLLFHHRTLPGFFGEVSRRSSNLDRQPILSTYLVLFTVCFAIDYILNQCT